MKNLKALLSHIATLDGWLSSHEGYLLYHAAKDEKGKGEIVEIGSWKGKSTICLAAGSKSKKREKITAIDPHKGEFSKGKGLRKSAPTYKEFIQNIKQAEVQDYVRPLVSTSEEAAKKWEQPIRLFFIDGLHDYKHTYQDFSLWEPFVKKEGIIAFHDAFCGHIGPERVILEEVFPNEGYSGFGVVGSIIYARKMKSKTFFEKLDRWRNVFLISLAIKFNKSKVPLRFFFIHRVIKLLLLNKYTYHLALNKIKL